MFEKHTVNKIIKKYKDKSISELSNAERVEVLKTMNDRLETDMVNFFIREENGSVSARKMTLKSYFSLMQESQGEMTVKDIMEKLKVI